MTETTRTASAYDSEAAALARNLVRQMPISVAVLDRHMNYLATSDPWVRDYGGGHADLSGLNHYEVHPDLPERLRQAHQLGLAGTTVKAEEQSSSAEGTSQCTRWVVQPWRQEDGTIGGIIITAEDTTDRNRAAEEARAVTSRYRALFEAAPIALATIRNPGGDVVAVNDAFLRLFEYTREEVVGRSLSELGIADAASKRRILEGLQSHGGVQDLECIRIAKSGAKRVVLLDARLVNTSGERQVLAAMRDITDQRRAEEAAREGSRHSQALFDAAPIALALLRSPSLELVAVNDSLVRLFGYKREELVGRTFVDLGISDRASTQQALAELQSTGEIRDFECVRTAKSGTRHVVLVDGRWADIPGGGHILAAVRDITDRKRLEEAAHLAEARATAILAASADAIITIDEEQRITSFNDGAVQMFQCSREDAIGASLQTLIPERFGVRHHDEVETLIKGQEASRRMGGDHRVLYGVRRGGEEFPLRALISKVEIGGQKVLAVALQDITQEQRIERAQRLLAELGRALADDGGLHQMMKRVSALLLQDLADFCVVDLFGEHGVLERREVTSGAGTRAACEALTQIQIERRHPHRLAAALQSGRSAVVERGTEELLLSWARDEEHLQALRGLDAKSVMAVPLPGRTGPAGLVVLVSSTSSARYTSDDERVLEEVARRAGLAIENARLYEASRRAIQVRDSVLGAVAHDIRSPLGTIILQTAGTQRRGGEPERRSRKPAEAITRAATRINRLIQDLLDVAAMEAGQLAIARSAVSAGQLVSQCVEAHSAKAAAATLELRSEIGRDAGDVWADRDRILQVFDNLVGNALKFTPEGSISVQAELREQEVIFSVADTGPGIPAADLPHLFDRFWQGTKADRRGAGLGLAIAKGIVEAHGGRIWVESTLAQGSTFFFSIPSAQAKEDGRQTGPTADR